MNSMKRCAKCGVVKPLSEFHRQPSGKNGRHCYCKPCANAVQKASRQKNGRPAAKRKWLLASRYRLTEAVVAAMLEQQQGRCGICRGEMKRPCIDHDHGTRKVRGLLCHRCNIGLPYVEDSTYRIAALAYLERTS